MPFVAVMGAVILLVALWIAALSATTVTIECSRETGDCTVTTRRLIPIERQAFALTDLKGARVDERPGSKGRSSYTVVLAVGDSDVRLPFTDGSRAGRVEVVERVEGFLNHPEQPTLEAVEGPTWVGVGFSVFLAGLGAFIALGGLCSTVYVFDRATGRLGVLQRGPLGGRNGDHALETLASVHFQRHVGSKSTYWTIEVVPVSGTAIALGAGLSDESNARRVAEAVSGFLAVPLEERRAG